jgi:hypothetical protein
LKQTLSRKRSPFQTFQTFNSFAQFKSFKKQKCNFEIREFSKIRRRSDAIAVGSLAFAEKVKSELGVKAMHREIAQVGGRYALREPGEAYRGEFDIESDALRAKNTTSWKQFAEIAGT